MARAKGIFGLQSSYRITKRCIKCDNLLEKSEYKGKIIVYGIGRFRFLCVKCSLMKSKNMKSSKTTIDDIENWINKQLGGKPI